MSSPTWTPAALSGELRPYAQQAWRLVESQHRVATVPLVDNLAEQEELERILEETKPVVPRECRHLDYLLFTPFRYGTPYPHGSRFRRAGLTAGVFYASEDVATAVAEFAFHKLLFFAESPDTPFPAAFGEHTAFCVALAAPRSLDLTAPRLDRDKRLWTHPTDYGPCQSLADGARAVETALIRYQSVRDPGGRANVAVFDCAAFGEPKPIDRQTWRIRLSAAGVQAISQFPDSRIELSPAVFSADPRIAAVRWEAR